MTKNQLTATIDRIIRALRQVPIFVPEQESSETIIGRLTAWRQGHAQAIEDAENIFCLGLIKGILSEGDRDEAVVLWYCEECGALGSINCHVCDGAGTVIRMMGDQHREASPQCTESPLRLKEFNPKAIGAPFFFRRRGGNP